MALANPVPMNLMWGPDLLQLYNDAYRDLIGERHPGALGQPVFEIWQEATNTFGPMLRQVIQTGTAVRYTDQPFILDRSGFREELFTTMAYSPIHDGEAVAGVLATLVETTGQVRGARRLGTLHRLATTSTGGDDGGEDTGTDRVICQRFIDVLAANPHDVPFAMIYLVDAQAATAHLAAVTGIPAGSPALDPLVTQHRPVAWPLQATMRDATAQTVDDLPARFPDLAAGPWPQPPHTALILPAGPLRDATPIAVLVLGVSSHAPLDAGYREFFDLVAEQIGATLATARAHRETAQRMAALKALDHAKTEFVANISHEFRRPLTLLLLPLEQQLVELPPELRDTARIAHRNALRLLRLVNSLLTFSELEQGRAAPAIERVEDLAGLTAELAAVFRSAIERARLQLVVDCPPLDRAVLLDPHMWETAVLNLLSNAFKHTFTGTITITLRPQPIHVELTVADTGVGIDPRYRSCSPASTGSKAPKRAATKAPASA